MNLPRDNRVLIVAGDSLDVVTTKKLIQKIDGTASIEVSTVMEAVEKAQSSEPDVVLFELNVDDPDSLELARQIVERLHVPTVALVDRETPELIEKTESLGIGAYLVKPPDLQRLEYALIVTRSRFEDMLTVRRKKAELEFLYEAGLRLTSSLELQPVLDALLEQTLKLVHADDAHIFFYDDDRLSFGAALLADGTIGQPIASPRPNGLTYEVARRGKRIVIQDVNKHPLFSKWQWGGAIVGIPLRFSNQVIGVMNVAFKQPHRFDDNELRILELVAAQAAIAMHNANLFAQVQNHAADMERRVAERTRELTAANERLQELDRLKSKFIGDISHELRTPATNVRLYLQLLEQGKPEKRDQYLSVIKGQTNRMVHLVEDILYFSQLELNKSKIKFSPVKLNLLAEQVVSTLRWRADAVGLELVFAPDPGLSPVRANSEQLSLVIKNLIDNAINYTPSGQVWVGTGLERSSDMAYLQVRDTGRGISPEDLPHLFERFYRGQGVGSSTISGSGLGLSIAHEIMNLHNGDIQVESTLGKGSRFTIRLPLADESE
jgi:signal transduction histidine kinase/AmiR/NasT family two-component response regulator